MWNHSTLNKKFTLSFLSILLIYYKLKWTIFCIFFSIFLSIITNLAYTWLITSVITLMLILTYVDIVYFVMLFRTNVLAFYLSKAVLLKVTLVVTIFILALMDLMIVGGIKTAILFAWVITFVMTLMIFLTFMGDIILMAIFYTTNILTIFNFTFEFTKMLFIYT